MKSPKFKVKHDQSTAFLLFCQVHIQQNLTVDGHFGPKSDSFIRIISHGVINKYIIESERSASQKI